MGKGYNRLDLINMESSSMDGSISLECRTLSVPEAAKALGIGRSAAYEAARTGQLPTIKIGKRILVPVVALERMLRECANPSIQEPS